MSGPVSVWDVGRGGNLSQSVCHAVVETLPTVLVASAVDSSGDAIPIMHATIVCCRERSDSAWHYDMMVVHAPYLPSGLPPLAAGSNLLPLSSAVVVWT